jgi:hypothetical protein
MPPRRDSPDRVRPAIDAGWLYLIAGLLLMASGVLIPAGRDLEMALWRRDRVLRAEMHRLQRLTRYEAYLEALENRDETVLRHLAVTQLGLTPADREVVLLAGDGEPGDASVFASLEPPPLRLPEPELTDSLLARWANGDRTRLWLLAGSSVLVLIGLLPSTRAEPAA